MSARTTRARGALLLTATLAALLTPAVATPAFAIDKEHRQMEADLRMLQEQSQQLQNLLGSITDAIKALNAKLDEQANANRKAVADEKLIVDNLTNDVRVIREKLDDNNVRLGSLSQEIDALRRGVQQIASRPAIGDAAPGAPADTATPPGAAQNAAPVGVSPQQLWDAAFSDYTIAQYDLAIQGFQSFIQSFPKDDRADDAQVYIGHCYMQAGKNDKAVEAYDMAIRNYPGGNAVPDAYYRRGVALRNLKQLDRAKDSFETVIKNYPDSAAASLARQQLAQPAR
jgi:tol-pal system protein YbgF